VIAEYWMSGDLRTCVREGEVIGRERLVNGQYLNKIIIKWEPQK
jgi:hypothetical protein